ncbi:low-specificity L-threonine aldolase [Shewanella sp. 3B26]|uniref:Low-specificity L-threonine aldolase n=1 Tax=Shewanella zhuhaiensis TaxID=2919576 RepID=A0AAJ1BIR1_9GAMM|nr:low-specificity L-threonine aldolase [Shewanella zhuhaiensis]MCH4295530.1 low-specificity L-threonine aldolase [Shewanella zhuhaiensis]
MPVDFRSDTVTQPTDAMRRAMFDAPLGDDVYGDDPTVNRLEAMAAEMLGFDNALFTSSGTQANLLALMSHCDRGDEYICGQQAHNYRFEGGGAAVLGSIQPQPLNNQADGSIALEDIEAAIKPDDVHYARTRLLSLENTIGGKVLPMSYLADAQALAFNRGLKIHLDGARLANAAVALNKPMAEIAGHFDSVSLCLSKGLCAPVGSLLLGDDRLIQKARRWRKMLGGGMRQAGVLAGAAIVALEQQVERLADDHDNAALLARELVQIDGFDVDMASVQTNMVFARVADNIDIQAVAAELSSRGFVISASKQLRLVTHKDISRADVHSFIAALKSICQ